jgi:spore germination protein GerM
MQRVDPSDVPFGLLSSSSSGTPLSERPGPRATVYLVQDDHLLRTQAPVTGANQPADSVRALLDGPSTIQTGNGLSTAIPNRTRLISLDVSGTVATVDLSDAFGEVGGAQQVLAVAQIVYTLTDSPRISAVGFAIMGKPIEVPDGSGSLAGTPRSRSDYRQVAAS